MESEQAPCEKLGTQAQVFKPGSEKIVTVKKKLSANLADMLSHAKERKDVEKLLKQHSIETKLRAGKFSVLFGSPDDMNAVEQELRKRYLITGEENGPHSSDVPANDQDDSTSYRHQQHKVSSSSQDAGGVANANGKLPVIPPRTNKQKGSGKSAAHEHWEHVVLDSTHQFSLGSDNAADVRNANPVAPLEQSGHSDNASTGQHQKLFHDEMDVEEYVWHYLLFKHANLLQELLAKYHCSFGLRHLIVDTNGRTQSRLHVSAASERNLHSAAEELARLVVILAEADVVQRKVDLCPKEHFQELENELQKKDVLLLSSQCSLIGPSSTLLAAEATVDAVVNNWHSSKQVPASLPLETLEKDIFMFHIPPELTVHIRQGDLVHQQTQAIVNPANVELKHGSGAARAIADAAGPQLEAECREYIKRKGKLKVAEPMHTSAGNLPEPTVFVIHIAGPRSRDYKDKDDCHRVLRCAFRNCLQYANKVVHVGSISLPAISSGVFGIDKHMCARMAYEGLMEFAQYLQSNSREPCHLKHVHFVNVDEVTTHTMANVMKSLHDKKCMVQSPANDMLPGEQQEWMQMRGSREDLGSNVDGKPTSPKQFVGHQPRLMLDQQPAGGQHSLPYMVGNPQDVGSAVDPEPSPIAPPPSGNQTPQSPDARGVDLFRKQKSFEPEAPHSPTSMGDVHVHRQASYDAPSPQSPPADIGRFHAQMSSEHHTPAVNSQQNLHPDMSNSNSQSDQTGEQLENDQSSLQDRRVIVATSQDGGDIDTGQDANAAALANYEGEQMCRTCNTMKSHCRQKPCKHLICPECIRDRTSNQQPLCNCGDWVMIQEDDIFQTAYGLAAVADDAAAKTDDGGTGAKDSDVASKPARRRELKKDDCAICLEPVTDPKRLDCGHTFCTDCIAHYFEKGQPKCPNCGKLFGILKGNQPPGTFHSRNMPRLHLSGYEHYRAIEITYNIPDGKQTEDHPNPGKWYKGTTRTAYLPDSPQGREVFGLLKRAFDHKLVFTVGRSITSGHDNVVVWNDIHHKTKPDGPYGYPDPGYLQRVMEELAAKGIVPDS